MKLTKELARKIRFFHLIDPGELDGVEEYAEWLEAILYCLKELYPKQILRVQYYLEINLSSIGVGRVTSGHFPGWGSEPSVAAKGGLSSFKTGFLWIS